MVSKEELTKFIADTYIATYGCIKNNQNYNSSVWLKQTFNQKIFVPNKVEEQTITTQFFTFKNGYGASIYKNATTGEYVISIGGADVVEYIGDSNIPTNNYKDLVDSCWKDFLNVLVCRLGFNPTTRRKKVIKIAA